MPGALPIIGGVLGIANAITGIQSQQASQRALSQSQGLSEEQAAEMRQIRAVLADPNNPVRQLLRQQAEAGISGQVNRGSNELLARLAASGLRSPVSAAPALANIAGRGVMAQGELERNLISDYLQKRIGLAGGPEVALRGGLGIADIAGQQATGAGSALGRILEWAYRNQQPPTTQPATFFPGSSSYDLTGLRQRAGSGGFI